MSKLLTLFLPLFLLTTSSTSHPTQVCMGYEPLHHTRCNKHPTFTLHDITFQSSTTYSTPAHLAVAEGSISFNLTSTAVPYTTHCVASSSRWPDFFYGEIVYRCDVPTGQGVGPEASANFTFSRPESSFNVNQTWSCVGGKDHGGKDGSGEDHSGEVSKTKKFLGTGNGTVPLVCQTTVWTNPNWSPGETYSVTTTTCQPAELQITPTVIRIH